MVYNLVFGLDAKTFDEKSECLDRAFTMFYSSSYEPIPSIVYAMFPWLRSMFPQQFTTPEFTVWFKALFDQAVELRKQSNASRDDYLNFLIELREKKNVSMDRIYAHAYTYFVDGFETTAYVLGNAINRLAINQHCQEKLRDEIKSFGDINFENLHQMPYLDAVLNGNAFFFSN